ncbi:hypothetical protein GCM10007938_30680 [Vibrio zhanjiangensis]|uniref:PepSY domain-containing protein n=1 Tax=Vibrio zhanjiangensis TaxID=1046128 RepID=A0ABQ6F2Y4_9VIBR|nr:hypothetical protein GCM10007938_30680 [Vibrio zhanjiangensis]
MAYAETWVYGNEHKPYYLAVKVDNEGNAYLYDENGNFAQTYISPSNYEH